MEKLNYLNVGCGNKYHKQWVNVDMASNSKDVIAANLLDGFPFPSDHFDVVYHSQVLEHIPKENAHAFIKECFRVLKTDGIIRVVVPDLENIVDEYKKVLKENIENPNEVSAANYEWVLLEMYDQTVRNKNGGQMAEYLKRPHIINENYVMDRIGFVGRGIRKYFLSESHSTTSKSIKKSFNPISELKNALISLLCKIYPQIMQKSTALKIGTFRLGGEIHYWMYDRYSLAKLLKECGFVDISIKSPTESDIPKWSDYELDVKDGLAYDPTSLFMEARKR